MHQQEIAVGEAVILHPELGGNRMKEGGLTRYYEIRCYAIDEQLLQLKGELFRMAYRQNGNNADSGILHAAQEADEAICREIMFGSANKKLEKIAAEIRMYALRRQWASEVIETNYPDILFYELNNGVKYLERVPLLDENSIDQIYLLVKCSPRFAAKAVRKIAKLGGHVSFREIENLEERINKGGVVSDSPIMSNNPFYNEDIKLKQTLLGLFGAKDNGVQDTRYSEIAQKGEQHARAN